MGLWFDMDIRPRDHVSALGKRYPEAWKSLDAFRVRKDLPTWPDWCFLPMAAYFNIIDASQANDLALFGALYPWRTTQGVYRFDPDIYAAVCDTPLAGNLPMDVFYCLPEWCIYIETPGIQTAAGKLHGAFVHLEWDANTERH